MIALACRKLPAHLRIKGILWGTAGAIVLRVVLIALHCAAASAFSEVGGCRTAVVDWYQVAGAAGEDGHSNAKVATSVGGGQDGYRGRLGHEC